MVAPARSLSDPAGGMVLHSEAQPGVSYVLEERVGEGGMGTAYRARREGADGVTAVVVKLTRVPRASAYASQLMAVKEAVALGRLNESIPPTPFVVRLLDTGSARFGGGDPTPWTALEYVHGGVEGTTLEDRVTYALHRTGYAFDWNRTAHAIRCLASGLHAIHSVGVIHRDLTPGNVLCCGFGESEMFKISDFGVARASGLQETFVGLHVGTLGYTAPEAGSPSAGPHTDVFSFAAIVYYLLTGQHLFPAESPIDAVRLFERHRPSITEHNTLCPELLERPLECRAIDDAIARATSMRVEERPPSPAIFAATVLATLSDTAGGPRSSTRLLSAVLDSAAARPNPSDYDFIACSHPRPDLAIASVAWDTDAHALALTSTGAAFWDGQGWNDATAFLSKAVGDVTFARRYEAGGWLLGGASTLTVLDASGVRETTTVPAHVHLTHASGRLDDLLVAVDQAGDGAVRLWTSTSRRWMRPHPLPEGVRVTTLERLDDSRWLVAGRHLHGKAYAAVFSPLEFEARELPTPNIRSFISGASAFERSLALLCGSDGVVLHVDRESVQSTLVREEQDLSAVAVDILDREWAATLGLLWSRDATRGEPWRPIWGDQSWGAPFVSLLAQPGLIVGMTADGAVIQGRARESVRSRPH